MAIHLDTLPDATMPARPETDMAPLAWIEPELRRQLDTALKSLRRYLGEHSRLVDPDTPPPDEALLRSARDHFHQAAGALEMIGLSSLSRLPAAMEATMARFAEMPDECTPQAVATVERAVFAVGEFLDAQLSGRHHSAVALYPQYRELQALAGVSKVHPAELWRPDATPAVPALVGTPAPLAYGTAARSQFDQKVLSVVKTGDAAAARTLSELSLRLAAGQPAGEARTFWQVCGGFFEAQALDLLPHDLHAKRVASRVLMQYSGLARGDGAVQPQLLLDMLFFCAHARPDPTRQAPALQAVRRAWSMEDDAPSDYELRRFGRFDPALLAQARKRIHNAAETWSALAGGDRARLQATADQFNLVADSLRRLHTQDTTLADALTRAIDTTVRRGEAPGTALAMEVATSVLYLQAAYESLDTSDQVMAEHATVLAARLDRATANSASPEPLDAWMEALYHRVSDRQTMGSVVDELRATQQQAEQALDTFFRAPLDVAPLPPVLGHLAQMRGVLSVLGLDQAVLAVVRMRDQVERLLLGEPTEKQDRDAVFEALGSSLGALGFLIDMLAYQPVLARKLFVFDEAVGALRVVMAHRPGAAAEPEVAVIEVDGVEEIVALAESAPVPEDADEDDFDLRAVFLDEAREVIAAGLASLEVLAARPEDASEQTALRRAFHTLKGSARMVGTAELEPLAEAAWAMEQLLNGWLAEQKPMPERHMSLSRRTLVALGEWVSDIERGDGAARDAGPIRTEADALRLGEVAGTGSETETETAQTVAAPVEAESWPELPPSLPPPEVIDPPAPALPELPELPELPVLDEVIEVPAPVEAESVIDPEPEPEPEPEPVDETKFIGDLRISIPLYNVYLQEADEWSRRLLTELGEWALELHRPVPVDASPMAHSLAGSSATVGFEALSGLARLLEQALDHVGHQRSGTPHQAGVFVDSAEDIRRLLHQFAAGFLKTPTPRLLRALQVIIDTEPQDVELPTAASFLRRVEADDFELQTAPEPEPAFAFPPATEPEPGLQPAPPVKAFEWPPLAEHLDLADAVDPDLFPIFEEEALELLPRLGTALRGWSASPGDVAPPAEVLRLLHTLKGSARLAGALRLGELAHRFESAIEGLDAAAHPERIEGLLAYADALDAEFESLRRLDAAAQASSLDTPVSLPAAPAVATTTTTTTPTAAAGVPVPQRAPLTTPNRGGGPSVRVRAGLLDRLVNDAGEVMISRSRLEARLGEMHMSLADLSGNLDRLRGQLRDVETQSESQMQSRLALAKDSAAGFDPLEFDRFTRVQELTRMMAESVDDVATVQRNLQRAMQGAEDDLVAQGRQARELQRDLLRTRMVEFESIADRLHAVVRQTAREAGRSVTLDISGGSVEMDRGVLERLLPPFEHLLRNAVVHGIEPASVRQAAGKPAIGSVVVAVRQEGNDVAIDISDDGAGLDFDRILVKALGAGLVSANAEPSKAALAELIFMPGFSTASELTELAGRGIGMDVVRSEVLGAGGRVEIHSVDGQGTRFALVLPLTTAVTQVVLLRAGGLTIGVPATVVELVRRVTAAELDTACASGTLAHAGEAVPFFWAGALLQSSAASLEPVGRTRPVIVFRSAQQRLALHVDEVLGQQEVVVKNLGPQLARLPGLSAMTVLPSGAVLPVYNPVALFKVYGEHIRAGMLAGHEGSSPLLADAATGLPVVPLVLVVDDSITVRRVTQRLLRREGWRVALASDGQQALERLREERPALVLSDIEMPRMDGFDLLRHLRADPATADLPVVMITSRIAAKHREYAASLGASHYLGKPYPEDELLALVRRYTQAGQASLPARTAE
jgi:chemosensory pili system protein ChpA (sensor histidine kinase/response regulator)